MDMIAALATLNALAQPTRLAGFRALARAGKNGMTAGEIGQCVGAVQNTMSSHLSVLLAAGLVRNRRDGRQIRYFADMDGFRCLLEYLLEDCCGGAPEKCRPFIGNIMAPAWDESSNDKCTT